MRRVAGPRTDSTARSGGPRRYQTGFDEMTHTDRKTARVRSTIAERARQVGGFTLVEMLIVMTLVGTAVGFSIESFRKYRSKQAARAGAMQLVTTFNMAKASASSVPHARMTATRS